MLSTELAALVSRVATTMTDKPAPTSAEILAALNRVAEEADRIGYARGSVRGANYTAKILSQIAGFDDG